MGNSEKPKHSQRQDMADLLKNVLEYLKVKKEVTKDNVAFRIVTVGSFGVFMLCSMLNGLTIYFGHPIICQDTVNKPLTEAHCWLHGSYDLRNDLIDDDQCFDEPPKNEVLGNKTTTEPKVRTRYYQWVVCVLVLSAILFRLPAWIWSMLERGLMANFYNSNKGLDVLREKEDDVKDFVEKEVNAFKRLQKRSKTKAYYLKFLFCQCLALLVVCLLFLGTDKFIGDNGNDDGRFLSYGSDVVKYHLRYSFSEEFAMKFFNYENKTKLREFKLKNPMCRTFPTRVACEFTSGGTGGEPSIENSYCILSQNIINEKIYLALWFWFVAMIAIMSAQLILEVCFLTSPLVDRILKLALPSSSGISNYLRQFLIGQVTGTSLTRNMVTYLQNLSFGDVFVLYQLGKNTHPDFFYEMLKKLSVNEKETETSETEPMLEENGVEMNSVVTSN